MRRVPLAAKSAPNIDLSRLTSHIGYRGPRAVGESGLARTKDAASFEKIDKAVERIRKHIEGFEEINTTATTVKNSAEDLGRARIMQDGLSTNQAVIEEVLKLKDDAATE